VSDEDCDEEDCDEAHVPRDMDADDEELDAFSR